jgi:hypothetical protein
VVEGSGRLLFWEYLSEKYRDGERKSDSTSLSHVTESLRKAQR